MKPVLDNPSESTRDDVLTFESKAGSSNRWTIELPDEAIQELRTDFPTYELTPETVPTE